MVEEIKSLIDEFKGVPVPISPQMMSELYLSVLCDLMFNYTPEKEIIKDELKKIIDNGPPFSSRDLDYCVLVSCTQS